MYDWTTYGPVVKEFRDHLGLNRVSGGPGYSLPPTVPFYACEPNEHGEWIPIVRNGELVPIEKLDDLRYV